jgi:hypothetical protein
MLAELDLDEASGSLYVSERLTPTGRLAYPGLLREAFARGDDESLANALAQPGIMAAYETSHRRGRPYRKRVPYGAPRTLAEGEFNRFYMRALCANVLGFGGDHLIVFRAKLVSSPRPGSEAMIGQAISADDLLEDLRTHPGVDTALGLPPGPNSGLSARYPR